MIENKEILLKGLHSLLSHNVVGDKQYINRYNGFNGELDFMRWFRANRPDNKTLSGGAFIPITSSEDSFKNSVYFTVSSFDPNTEENIFIYSRLQSLAQIGQFYFWYDSEELLSSWEYSVSFPVIGSNEIKLLTPKSLKVYKFDNENCTFQLSTIQRFIDCCGFKKGKSKLANIPESIYKKYLDLFLNYDFQDIKSMYLERLVFDGICGLANGRGAPLDIDLFVQGDNGGWNILEIKEKDKSKNYPKGFGMDLRRIKSLRFLQDTIKIPAVYIVRHVADQIDRAFLEWSAINFNKFYKKIELSPTVEGGFGMRSERSSNPTKVCEYEYFSRLE